ncbi:MAG: hypothetical protein DMD35_01810 [Gemmatimonadetes bacterium]|nr:MAG: hypothetical protein DMD35_01810 [Gemmatimonadota bacterium]
MLLALLVTLLAASPIPTDSVRVAAKPGTARQDTTLSSLPAPAIAVPTQKAPEVVLTMRPVTALAPFVAKPMMGSVAEASHNTTLIQQAVAVAPAVAAPAPAVQKSVAVATPTGTSAKDSPASPGAAAKDSPARASSVNSAVPKPPTLAPADAVATAPADPRNVATTTRVDPRTVVSVRTSDRFEPLYAVPIPLAGFRLPPPAAADSIVVFKRERTLVLFNRGVPIRTYFIALGSKPVGDKERAGDQKTPEGLFYINAHNPASKFHLALRISYPDDAHRARAAALGVDPGGDIMIHGLPLEYSEAGKKHIQNDWTNGCVALSNQEIEELWHAVPDGTPVQIKP